jgi:hypothetical protein
VLDRRTGEEIEAIRLCGDCLLVDVTADDARIVAVTVETAVAEPPIDTPTTHVVDVGAWTVRAIPDVGSLYAEAVSVVDDAIVVAQQGTEPAGDGASGTLRSVALADGDVRWEREAATADVSVAGDEHVLLLGDTTTALDAATGTELWTADGGYDLATGDDVVVVVSHDGGGTRVHAHDLGDGSLLWEWFVADGPRDVTAGAGVVVVPLHEGDELSVDRAEADEIQPPPVDTAPVEEVPIEEIPAETEAPAETETRVPEPAPVPAGQLTLGDVLDRIEAALDAEPIVLGDGVTLLARVGPCATGTPGSWSDVDEETPAGRGTTVLCASGTEPEGYTETGEMLVVVLDDAGRVATQVATDGSTSNPFVAPPGMLCRDYLATYHSGGGNFDERAAYTELLAYWFLEGEPDRMDVDHDGVPCETLFAAEVVADVWSGSN